MEIITFNLNKLLSLMLEKSIYWIIEQYMTIGGKISTCFMLVAFINYRIINLYFPLFSSPFKYIINQQRRKFIYTYPFSFFFISSILRLNGLGNRLFPSVLWLTVYNVLIVLIMVTRVLYFHPMPREIDSISSSFICRTCINHRNLISYFIIIIIIIIFFWTIRTSVF